MLHPLLTQSNVTLTADTVQCYTHCSHKLPLLHSLLTQATFVTLTIDPVPIVYARV